MSKPKKVYMVWGIKKDGNIAIPDNLFYDFNEAKAAQETIWKTLGDKYKWLDIKEMKVR